MQSNKENSSSKNLILAIVLSTLVIIVWGYIFPTNSKKSSKSLENQSSTSASTENSMVAYASNADNATKVTKPKTAEEKEVVLKNVSMMVKINTKGLKVKDIILLDDTVQSSLIDSEIFAQTGFISQTHSVPNNNTVWKVVESSENSATFGTNMGGVVFVQRVSFAEENLLKFDVEIKNGSEFPVSLSAFARVNQTLDEKPSKNAISHEGAIAYVDSRLYEKPYHKMKKENFKFDSSGKERLWMGFSDKYTLVSYIIDGEQTVGFTHPRANDKVFQSDAISSVYTVEAKGNANISSLLFIGKKRLQTLEAIAKKYEVPHLDKAIDFGFLYFITKPIFLLLHFIYSNVGSFAVAIALLTLTIKLICLPLTIKSSISMAKMKKLQPEIKKLQEMYKDDKRSLGQATIKLYQQKQVNPLAGCLPMLVQIPIFFALYKVLYVSTEMKDAKLFFWIKDLSSPDPTSILNLFGLLPFHVPAFLGVLPIAFGISMFLYQKVSPQPADKAQAQMMKLLPIIMTVFLSSFAAGLLFYWIVNNVLSIIQQIVIEKLIIPRHHRKHSYTK